MTTTDEILSEQTLIIAVRDVSQTLAVGERSRVVAGLVLDVDTGLTGGVALAATPGTACAEAMHSLLDTPPGAPSPRVVCTARPMCTAGTAAGSPCELARQYPDVAGELTPAGLLVEVEDLFDEFVGHLAGRAQAAEPATTADWRHLYVAAWEFGRRQPWRRRPATDHLELVVRVDGADTRYVARVLGHAGVQRGLMLYPGAVPPGRSPGVPPGAVVLWLDPVAEAGAEYVAKATRHGWPDGAAEVPVHRTYTEDGPADLDRSAVRHLTLALESVLEQ